MSEEILTVSAFIALLNQTLEFAYPLVTIEGEVSSFKINQNKWVFFDLKDNESTVGCFMSRYQLHVPIEDGMLIRVLASPRLTKGGKFSLTVKEIELAGEGDVKKAFDKLKAQFAAEGLFDEARKRTLPKIPRRVALITSAQAAAYNDFVTVLTESWPHIELDHLQVYVQGLQAPESIAAALNHVSNRKDYYDVVVVIRGGGSLEDLQAFNHELVVRAIYGSKVPSLVAIGHENDISLAELAADMRGATPTDAARRLVPDQVEINATLRSLNTRLASGVSTVHERSNRTIAHLFQIASAVVAAAEHKTSESMLRMRRDITSAVEVAIAKLSTQSQLLGTLSPKQVLARGYSIAMLNGAAIIRAADAKRGDDIVIHLHQGSITSEVKDINQSHD